MNTTIAAIQPITSTTPQAPPPPVAADPTAVPADQVNLSKRPTGWRRVAKTTGAALLGGAMLAVPAALGLFGGAIGVAVATAGAAGLGWFAGHKEDKGMQKFMACVLGVVSFAASAAAARGGLVGAGIAVGVGMLLGLAGDAVNRGTKPDY